MDGNAKLGHKSCAGDYYAVQSTILTTRLFFRRVLHIPVLWIPAIPAGMTMLLRVLRTFVVKIFSYY
jgi:hypothetical protein